MAQNLEFWHGVTMLHGHGRAASKKTEERSGQRIGTGCPCHEARPCQGKKSCRLEMAARVRAGVGFWKVAARVVKGETLPHRPYIKGVKDLVSIINQNRKE